MGTWPQGVIVSGAARGRSGRGLPERAEERRGHGVPGAGVDRAPLTGRAGHVESAPRSSTRREPLPAPASMITVGDYFTRSEKKASSA